MKAQILVLVFGLGIFLLVAGCTQAPQETAPVTTVTTAPTFAELTTEPTDEVPGEQNILVSVSRGTLSFDPTIRVEFRGGSGIILLSAIDATVTREDGSVETARMIEPDIGESVELSGSTGKDRVEVTVYLKNGRSYRIYDEILEFRK
jgi:ABC-type transport system substrate-binding protein